MNGDSSSQPSLRRRFSHPPRPSSSCIDAFRRQKLRYAEGLKRHFVDGDDDDPDNSRKDNENGATSSKKRHVSSSSSTDKRRASARPLSANGALDAQADEQQTRRNKKWCARCSKTFPSAAELQKHSASHGSTVGSSCTTPYKCPLCSQAFQSLSVIKAHVNSAHV